MEFDYIVFSHVVLLPDYKTKWADAIDWLFTLSLCEKYILWVSVFVSISIVIFWYSRVKSLIVRQPIAGKIYLCPIVSHFLRFISICIGHCLHHQYRFCFVFLFIFICLIVSCRWASRNEMLSCTWNKGNRYALFQTIYINFSSFLLSWLLALSIWVCECVCVDGIQSYTNRKSTWYICVIYTQ